MRKTLRALVVVAACTAAALATTIIPMSLEDMARAASDIVEAHAVLSWTSWNPQHTLIYTYTSFQVRSRLKGFAPETVIVKQVGGSSDGYTQKVSGVRQFQTGEDALLFLRPSAAADGSLVIVGLVQGNFRVYHSPTGEAMVSNGVTSAEQYDHGRVKSFSGTSTRLQDAEARISRALQ